MKEPLGIIDRYVIIVEIVMQKYGYPQVIEFPKEEPAKETCERELYRLAS